MTDDRPDRDPAHLTVTVYTREGCHLCEEAIDSIHRSATATDTEIALEAVDVDERPALRAEYGDRLPCVFVNGEQLFEYRVDEYSLRSRFTDG